MSSWIGTKFTKMINLTSKKEMQEYCISDVDILLQACWKFRQLLKSQTGQECQIEDLENMITKTIRKMQWTVFSFLTIASVCMGIFRAKFPHRKMVCIDKKQV